MGIEYRANGPIVETAQSSANVWVREYDPELARAFASGLGLDYDAQNRKRKLAICRAIPPKRITRSHNTTCIALDEYRAENLSATHTTNEEVDRLAVGRGSGDPLHGDRSLNDEIGRIAVASSEPQGQTLTIATLIDAGEMNGETLNEVGLYTDGNRLLNHSLINPVDKTDQKSVTVEVRLTFDTA